MSDLDALDATPPAMPEFWAEQTRALADDLNAIAAAFTDLAERIPRAIHQAADLGLMREQHDVAGLATAVRGDLQLNAARDQAQAIDHSALEQLRGDLIALRGEVALLRHRLDAVAGGAP